jgi:beta-glucosidase
LVSLSTEEVARQAVRESIVLLKNNNNVLPIKANKHILVIGEAANKITKHMGGWTITWQGRENANEDFPNTLSIYEAIKSKAEANGSTVEFSNNSSYKNKPDLVIFVYGEDPYAEGDGDRNTLFYQNYDRKFKKYMKNIYDQEISTVSLFISGRPLIVNEELNLSDAFVQLWLPGSAIEGMTDVIFTNAENQIIYDFKGKTIILMA